MKRTIVLISGTTEIVCENPVYYARRSKSVVRKLVPSHVVVHSKLEPHLDEICYIRLSRGRVPVLVTVQPDGTIWLGGAYLDTIAAELRLIPRPLPRELEGKTREWLAAVAERWQLPTGDESENPT